MRYPHPMDKTKEQHVVPALLGCNANEPQPTDEDLDHGTGLDPEERFWLEFDAWREANG